MADVIAPQNQALANFPFNDVAQGISNLPFYGGNHIEEDGGLQDTNIFSNSSFYSSYIVHKVYGNELHQYTLSLTKEFDLSFGAPRIVNGTVIVNVPMGFGDAKDGDWGQEAGVRGVFTLYHVDVNDNETALGGGSKQTEDFEESSIADNGQYGTIFCEFFSVSNQKFRRGEKLRLKVQLYAYTNSAHYVVFGIGCDPQNRNDFEGNGVEGGDSSKAWKCFPDSVDTNLIIQVPFKIDV